MYCTSGHPQRQSQHVLRQPMSSLLQVKLLTLKLLFEISETCTCTLRPYQQSAPRHRGFTCAFFCLLFLAALKPCSPRSDQVMLSIHGSVYLFICFLRNSISNLFFLFLFTIVRWTNYFMLLHPLYITFRWVLSVFEYSL